MGDTKGDPKSIWVEGDLYPACFNSGFAWILVLEEAWSQPGSLCLRRLEQEQSQTVLLLCCCVKSSVIVLVLSGGAGEVTCPSQQRFWGRVVHIKEEVWAEGIPRENACLCRMVVSVSTYASHPTAILSVGNVLPFPSRWTWLPLWVGSESCILLAALFLWLGALEHEFP